MPVTGNAIEAPGATGAQAQPSSTKELQLLSTPSPQTSSAGPTKPAPPQAPYAPHWQVALQVRRWVPRVAGPHLAAAGLGLHRPGGARALAQAGREGAPLAGAGAGRALVAALAAGAGEDVAGAAGTGGGRVAGAPDAGGAGLLAGAAGRVAGSSQVLVGGPVAIIVQAVTDLGGAGPDGHAGASVASLACPALGDAPPDAVGVAEPDCRAGAVAGAGPAGTVDDAVPGIAVLAAGAGGDVAPGAVCVADLHPVARHCRVPAAQAGAETQDPASQRSVAAQAGPSSQVPLEPQVWTRAPMQRLVSGRHSTGPRQAPASQCCSEAHFTTTTQVPLASHTWTLWSPQDREPGRQSSCGSGV